VDIIITERCSLKCGNCSNLMQYYLKPTDCNSKGLRKSLDSFFNVVDEVNEFRVIGGEPFMNKDFDLTIKRLVNEPKVKKIVIYTNGTIVPKEDKIDCLKNDKTLLLITDYGTLSRNLETLTQKLSDNDISFYVQKANGWTDCSKISKHYRDIKQQKEIFRNCCAKNTFTLSEGKLYRCPFSANADRLKAVPDFENDYINTLNENIGVIEMKNKIREFLLEKKFLKVCDYCNGRSFGDPEIEPAIQIKKPLEYKRYE
jgi:MoaA/NifB/PqqE/SkfB family radical SAM enzyme